MTLCDRPLPGTELVRSSSCPPLSVARDDAAPAPPEMHRAQSQSVKPASHGFIATPVTVGALLAAASSLRPVPARERDTTGRDRLLAAIRCGRLADEPRDPLFAAVVRHDAAQVAAAAAAAAAARDAAAAAEAQLPEEWCVVCWGTTIEAGPRLLACCSAAICRACIINHVSSTVTEPTTRCLNWECGAELSQAFVESLIPASTIDRRRRARLERDTKRFCPNPTCSEPIPNEVTGRNVTCSKCKARSCMRCHKAGHFGPCLAKKDRSGVSRWAATKDAKTCPSCSKLIEKAGGCIHMTCRTTAGGCGHEFCWGCKHDWRNHDGVHAFLCPWRTVWHGGNRYFGPVAPVRAVTKTVAVGLVVSAAGVVAGLAVGGAALSPLFLVGRKGVRKVRAARRSRDERRRDWMRQQYLSGNRTTFTADELDTSAVDAMTIEPSWM